MNFRHFFLVTIFLLSLYSTYSQQSWVELMNSPEHNFYEVQQQFYLDNQGKAEEDIPGWKQFKRWEYFMQNRVDSDGVFRHQTAANDVFSQYLTARTTDKDSKGAAGRWTQIGPFDPPLGSGAGRTNCIAFHPTNANIILAGSASGGLWRSVNGGQSWSSNTDGLENLGISDIVFAPSNANIVYAATGDRDAGDTYSVGLIKSIDGGIQWQTTGLSYPVNAKRKIHKVWVHPTDDQKVMIATNTGLYLSSDGGQNWALKKAGSFYDVKGKPGNPNILYACTQAVVVRSTNGGQSWSILNVPFATSRSRLLLATTPADSNYLYVIAVKSSDNSFGGIYRSTDGGNSFQQRATSPNILGRDPGGNDNVGQGWYDLALTVSESNPNLVLVGGVNVWRSANGGSSWSLVGHWTGQSASYVHADIHMLKFSPHSNTTVWACTDGGLSRSTNNGSSWLEKNSGLSIAQMYRLGASATNAQKILTGWQDNGTNYYHASWNKVMGGDGMECIIDYSNNNTMYASLYYGNLQRSTNGGYNWVKISNPIPENGAWVTPYMQDPNNPSTLYAGYKNVYKSTNKGSSWQAITSGNGQTITALAVAPSNSNVIYYANRFNIFRSSNGGQSWSNITGNFGSGNITSIAVHPTKPNKLWVTKSGYYNGNKVWQSKDGGQSWTNISGSLPNLPANTIVYEKNSADGLYVGMDVGVYYRDTLLGSWIPFMKNLPNVIVQELEIFYPTHKIRAATFGRGLWESDLYYLANGIEKNNDEGQTKNEISIFPNPTQGVFTLDFGAQGSRDSHVKILTITGETMSEFVVSVKNSIILNISDYPLGVYIVRIENEKEIINKKVILQK